MPDRLTIAGILLIGIAIGFVGAVALREVVERGWFMEGGL